MISSNPNKLRNSNQTGLKQLESLFTVLQKKASLPADKILDPLDNVIATDHTIEIERQLFDGIINSFIDKQEKGKACSAEELESLRFFCHRLRTSEMEVINAKKKATETTTLLNNQFDAGQVLSLVKQLPGVIQKELDTILGNVFADVVESLEQDDKTKKALCSKTVHPLLGKMKAFEIAKITNMVADRLSSLIENITIPGSYDEQQAGKDGAASLKDVEGMLNSLITVDTENSSLIVDEAV